MKKVKITEKQAKLLGINNIGKAIGEKKTLKEGVKNIVKITKEQYNRIFASGLIKESDLDTAKASVENGDPLTKETQELIKYLYRKTDEFSPFWGEHGITYDDIIDALQSSNLIVGDNGKYTLSRKSGSPQAAVKALEAELRTLMGGSEKKNETPANVEPETEVVEDSNVPVGANSNPKAPWRGGDDKSTPNKPKEIKLEVVAYNREVAILKDPQGNLYTFYYDHINNNEFMQYAAVTRRFTGKDEEGQPEYDYDEDFDIDADVISNYVNHNLDKLSKGEGLGAYESGIDIVKIDEPLKQELLNLYDKDKNFIKVLNPVAENFGDSFNKFSDDIKSNATPNPSVKPKQQSSIVAKLKQLRQKELARREAEKGGQANAGVEEMTGAASSGAFTTALSMPVVKKEMPVDANTLNVPIVGEMTSGSDSVGAYDVNALPNIGRNGDFKNKQVKEDNTQYPDGGFVKFNDCTKLNNKPAGSGCSQGAVDNVVSVKKTKGNVSAPSLGE